MGIHRSRLTSCSINGSGNRGARSAGPTGWWVPGWSTGSRGSLKSAWMLYHSRGSWLSGSTIFVSLTIPRPSPRVPPVVLWLVPPITGFGLRRALAAPVEQPAHVPGASVRCSFAAPVAHPFGRGREGIPDTGGLQPPPESALAKTLVCFDFRLSFFGSSQIRMFDTTFPLRYIYCRRVP